jgi:ribosomal protein S18 acetylase RimI-like enzyme
MIKQIFELPTIDESNVIEGRIEAYFRAYGGEYDFCRFYSGENILMMNYCGEFFISVKVDFDKEELYFFLENSGMTSATMDSACYKALSEMIYGFSSEPLYLMESDSVGISDDGSFTESYSEVFLVIKDAFDISNDSFGGWYTDICHRVRHKVSRLIALQDFSACCTVLYENGKTCFLSHIGVKKEYQGKGLGKKLLRNANRLLKNKNLSLLCKADKREFYKSCGFICENEPMAYQIVKER